VVAALGDINVAFAINGDSRWILKLTFLASFRPTSAN